MASTPEFWRHHHGGDARGDTLLVIDDDPINCRLMRAIFERAGLQVLAAPDGQSGIERAVAARPDLVLLDLQLPGADGIEILEALRAADPGLPVVMLTASHDPKTVV